MRSPGFLSQLQTQLESVEVTALETVNETGGLEIADMINYVLHPVDHTVYDPEDVAVVSAFVSDEKCHMGPSVGLCLNISSPEDADKARRILKDYSGMSWLVVPKSCMSEVSAVIQENKSKVLQRNLTFGLSPDNQLARTADGAPVLLTCGTGDGLAALTASQELENFTSAGGKWVVLIDVSTFDEKIDVAKLIKQHIVGGKPVTCAVSKPDDLEKVIGILCNHDGVDKIVECHRIITDRKFSQFSWCASGVLVLETKFLDPSSLRWNWCRTKRNVEGQLVVQFERSMYDLTAFYQTQYVQA